MTNVYGDQTVKSLQNIKHPGGAGVFSSSAWFPITSELLIFKNFFSYFIISSLCLLLFVPFVLDAFCPGCLHQNKQKKHVRRKALYWWEDWGHNLFGPFLNPALLVCPYNFIVKLFRWRLLVMRTWCHQVYQYLIHDMLRSWLTWLLHCVTVSPSSR